MFSNNEKISEKQLTRMLLLPLFSSTIFIFPYLFAKLFRQQIFWGAVVVFGFGVIYIIYQYWAGSIFTWSRHKNLGISKVLLVLIQVLRLLARLIFYISLSLVILSEAQVPFMPEKMGKSGQHMESILVLLPLLLVCIYGANVVNTNKISGIERQGRIHEIIFYLLFVPFIVINLFGLGEVDYGIFLPKKIDDIGSLFLCGYMLITFLLPVENYLFLRPCLAKRAESEGGSSSRGGKSFAYMIVTLLVVVLLSLLLLGIYGVNGAVGEEMVTIGIMRYIRLPFGVLERFDVLMVWFFMTGSFVLICGTLFYIGHLLSWVFSGVARIWIIVVVMAIAVAVVAFMPSYKIVLDAFLQYGAYVDLPLSILLPLLGAGVNKLEQEGNAA